MAKKAEKKSIKKRQRNTLAFEQKKVQNLMGSAATIHAE